MTSQRMMEITYHPIGVIRSPFKEIEGMPIQPAGAQGVQGRLEILPEYVPGLKDLEGFSHIMILYHFHQAPEAKMEVIPFLDSQPRGVFATRSPARPNPIGLSIVKLLSIKGNMLEVENLDILDGTPLLDIKPHVPQFDHQPVERTGWLSQPHAEVNQARSDDRFRRAS